jgi:CubicO group peptidase (beta-lactamase class C family)
MNMPVITPDNWYWGPGNRWAFRNMRRLFPTARISRGEGPVTPLPVAIQPVDHIRFTDPVSGQPSRVGDIYAATWLDSLLVLKDGAIAAERYFNGAAPDEPHLLMSISKSIAGSLTGILVERGLVELEREVTSYLPELAGTAYEGATVRHLLDMQVAMRFDNDALSATSDINRMDESVGWVPRGPHAAPGIKAWLATLVDRPLGPHGEKFLYLSQGTSVLTWVLERATGVELPLLIQELIWSRLGAEHDAAMVLDGYQQSYSPAGLNITLRDLGRFGQMMLQDGIFGGRRIVPSEWIRDIRSAGSAAAWQAAVLNRARDTFKGYAAGAYRSFWWVAEPACGRYLGLGLGAQMLLIDPRANMVAVAFSSPPSAADGETASVTHYHAIDAIIGALSG